jgi:hypothetical protein
MASRIHVSKSHLSNIETGRRNVTPDVVLAYERVIREEMKRRGVLTGIGLAAAAPFAVGQLIADGFTAALSAKSGVDEWTAKVEGYGRDYMTVGAEALRTRLGTDLLALQQHLETPAMWGNAARMLTTYGKTTPDSREAVQWYRLAAMLADRSGDIDTMVWVRSRAALALAYEGAEVPIAANLAEHALALSERPTLGRLNALVARAHVAAARGDEAGAIRADDEARRVFDRVASPEQISDFAVPEWRMATFRSMLYARLGHVKRGEEAQATADQTRPPTLPRFATHIELHRALMLVRARSVADGVGAARAAMARLPVERQSLSLRLMLAEIEAAARRPQ